MWKGFPDKRDDLPPRDTESPRWPTGRGYHRDKCHSLSPSFNFLPRHPLAKSNKNQRTQEPIDVDHKISLQKVHNRSTGAN